MSIHLIDPAAISLPPTQSVDITSYLHDLGGDPPRPEASPQRASSR